jgi:hypothetical protein
MWDRRTHASKRRLKVSKRRSGDSWVKVQGELDLTTVDELEVELEPRNGTLVILDLSGCGTD